jgi:hypothetical protein
MRHSTGLIFAQATNSGVVSSPRENGFDLVQHGDGDILTVGLRDFGGAPHDGGQGPHVAGAEHRHHFDQVGGLMIGDRRLRLVRRAVRCAGAALVPARIRAPLAIRGLVLAGRGAGLSAGVFAAASKFELNLRATSCPPNP